MLTQSAKIDMLQPMKKLILTFCFCLGNHVFAVEPVLEKEISVTMTDVNRDEEYNIKLIRNSEDPNLIDLWIYSAKTAQPKNSTWSFKLNHPKQIEYLTEIARFLENSPNSIFALSKEDGRTLMFFTKNEKVGAAFIVHNESDNTPFHYLVRTDAFQ